MADNSDRPAQREPERKISVRSDEGRLVVDGALGEGAATDWGGVALDAKKILLVSDDAKAALPPTPAGIGSGPVELFKDFLLALHGAGWSGMVSVDTGQGVKKIYFVDGNLAFAASNVIDDRLGEVIYREARISLDQLTDSAARVTKARKFGQVLIASGTFTNTQLWQALKLQVKQILRSLFMVDSVFWAMQEGKGGLAPTEVVFTESLPELVSECYAYGCGFRAFLARLTVETEVQLLGAKDQVAADHAEGTFTGDLLALIEAQPKIQDLLNASKLIDTYTVAALFHLVNLALCKVVPDADESRRAKAAPKLKAKIDAYGYVLNAVKKAFSEAKAPFPVADVRDFASRLNPEGFPSIYLDADGNLGKDCVSGVYHQCAANAARAGYFTVRVESLIQFLLQVAGDNLAFDVAKRIRQDYRSVSA
jgi:hypothetical protein